MIFDKIKNIFGGNKLKSNQNLSNENDDLKGDNNSDDTNAIEEVTETENTVNEEIENDNIIEDNEKIQSDNITEDNETINIEQEPIKEDIKQEADPEDIDAMINQLLEEDSKTELLESNTDFVNDVSVYDTVEKEINSEAISDEKSEVLTEAEKLENKKYLIFYIAVGALILIIISMCMVLLFQVSKYKKVLLARAQGTVIEQPAYRANNANYIYVSQEAALYKKDINGNEVEDIKIKLSKILFDSVATLFYFDSNIDLHRYNIMLVDDRNNMYNMDLSFVQSTKPEDNKNGTIIRFEPVFHTAKSITLTIFNPETGERVDFHFTMSEPIESTPVKYVTNTPLSEENNKINITIDNAVFSSAGSKLEYTIKYPNANYYVVQGSQNDDNSIVLEEGVSNITPTKNYPSVYAFENGKILLGRMDFESISNLNSKIKITFKDLFKKYVINKDIPANELSGSGEDKSYSIDVDNYKIVFEGLGLFEDKYVLVAHAEDKNIKISDKESMNNRVKVEFDAELVAKTSSGMEVVLNGKCTSAQYGTDMIIPINENTKNFIYGVNRDNIKIKVKSILIETQPISKYIELTKVPNENDITRAQAQRDVIEIFEKRLEYKSGTRNFVALSGFSDKILQDKVLFQNYTPQDITEPAQYSAQIISSFIDNNKYYAVVQEVWKGINGIQESHYYCTHKIVATKGEVNWTVIEDTIIK